MVFCYFYKFEQFGKKNLNILKGEPQVVIRNGQNIQWPKEKNKKDKQWSTEHLIFDQHELYKKKREWKHVFVVFKKWNTI